MTDGDRVSVGPQRSHRINSAGRCIARWEVRGRKNVGLTSATESPKTGFPPALASPITIS